MFYEEHERKIYHPASAPEGMIYDPLALDRTLIRATGGRLSGLVSDWQSVNDKDGDVSPGSDARNSLRSAEAEEQLVVAARIAFGLPGFPECLDSTALEYLIDFLGYMAGKGKRVTITRSSPITVPVA